MKEVRISTAWPQELPKAWAMPRPEQEAGRLGRGSCQVTGSIRRRLSCTFIRAQALCLISRIGQLGPGSRTAAVRREDALKANTVRRMEAQAHWQAHIKGRGLGRVGMVFVP